MPIDDILIFFHRGTLYGYFVWEDFQNSFLFDLSGAMLWTSIGLFLAGWGHEYL